MARIRCANPVAQRAGLSDSTPDIGQSQCTDQMATPGIEDKEGISGIVIDIAVILPHTGPEGAARQVVGGPHWFPGCEEIPAGEAQIGPLLEIGHVGYAQDDVGITQRRRRISGEGGAQEGHGGYAKWATILS